MLSPPTNPENNNDTVTLTSREGMDFVVEKAIAMEFSTVKHCMEVGYTVIPLPNVSSVFLPRIIAYCRGRLDLRNNGALQRQLKAFDEQFVKEQSLEDVQHLVMAANFLEFSQLQDIMAQAIADHIANKSAAYVRKFFGIQNDYTERELEELRKRDAFAYEGVDPDDFLP